ncbi:Glycosyl transferase family 2 [Actinopolyspora lacussalsi subsp. righensis]|uniref:Glycosyl transferase family 2 n=2 Tax=Actinopolyspora righensis TaxID=995060 RepID=A0A1I7BJ89_9ACTN|nr:glycosyltransferase family 2 protein [Actinopolyspora righensis]SFT87181.1 Glycosyl transferase family 2 [Actinopolyspora righensis]
MIRHDRASEPHPEFGAMPRPPLNETADVEVVLPCLDEAAALPAVLDSIVEGLAVPVLVVDNGSTDGSPEVAAQHGARVVHESRPGYGAAVHTGLTHARGRVICVLDADGSVEPTELPALINPVVEGAADLVVGKRVPTVRSAMAWHVRVGNAAIAALIRRNGLPVHDLAPVRVADRVKLLDLDIQDRAFGYPLELLLRAGRAGWRVRELPVRYSPRTSGTRSKVSGSMKGTARAVRDMIKVLR